MVIGGTRHVITHDIHKVNIGVNGLEIHVSPRGGRGEGEQLPLPYSCAYVFHEEGVILGILWASTDASRGRGGVFPVYIDTVYSVFLNDFVAVISKGLTQLGISCHFAKTPTAPAAYGEQYFQFGVFLLQLSDARQSRCIIYLN